MLAAGPPPGPTHITCAESTVSAHLDILGEGTTPTSAQLITPPNPHPSPPAALDCHSPPTASFRDSPFSGPTLPHAPAHLRGSWVTCGPASVSSERQTDTLDVY